MSDKTYKRDISDKVYGDDFMHKGKWFRTSTRINETDRYALPLTGRGGFQSGEKVVFTGKK